jgi:UDP-GlcNAc:undecaprenyl-phosphate GlcNAc-1-phosphate transferase
MGDSGSLFLGFVASSLSLGTSYTGKTELGILTPVIILAIPLFDTLLVFYCRIKKGVSPFIGSKDHFALRMESMGWKRRNILAFTLIFASLLCVCASFITESTAVVAVSLYMLVAVALGIFTAYVLKINVR